MPRNKQQYEPVDAGNMHLSSSVGYLLTCDLFNPQCLVARGNTVNLPPSSFSRQRFSGLI